LDWLFGGFKLFGSPPSDLSEQTENIEIDQRNKLPNKSFQRRISKVEPDESRGVLRGRVLNRPPVKGYQPPKRPPPSFQRKPNIPAPIIISSYASTSIQGRGQQDQERIRDKIDQYEKLNDISTDDVEQKEEKVKLEEISETETEQVTETEEIVTTTQRTEEQTIKSLKETTSPVITEFAEYDIIEDSSSPYLPDIPEKLDDEIHGVHLAGYQEVPEVKTNSGVDRTEQVLEKKKVGNRENVFPLGKPKTVVPSAAQPAQPAQPPKPPQPFQAGQTAPPPNRKPFKPSNKQRSPTKPVDKEASFFDFLPFWGSSRVEQEKKPRRPIGPHRPPPARPALDRTGEELPVRAETAVQPSISSRIDSTISENEEENDAQAYIVLPSKELKPNQEKPSRVKIGPQRPPKPFKGPRLPPPPRPRLPPPVARPLLPRVPASRKQAPFIAKRPLPPLKVPAGFSGSQGKSPTNSATIKETSSSTTLKKPLEKLFKKGESLSPKVIAKLTSQTKVHDGKKPFDFRPNGSVEKQSQISSHLSSIMNFLFQTTPSPAPAPSLPSLVEDTEFADIVNGYKASDKNVSESVDEGKEKEISTTTPASKTLSTLKPARNQDKIDIYDELDSLTAPVPDKPQNLNKIIKSKRPLSPALPPPPPPPHFSQKRPPFRPKLKPTTTKIPTTITTTTTSSSLPPVRSTTTELTTTTTSSGTSTIKPRKSTTFPAPIQALVEEYKQKGHVVSQETYPQPVLMAIKKNFEHKKKIFSPSL